MKKIIIAVMLLSLVFSLFGCGGSAIAQGKSAYDSGDYNGAFELFKSYKDSNGGSSEVDGYIYGCAYHILQDELKRTGDKKYQVTGLSSSDEYTISVRDFKDRICIAYEGTSVYISTNPSCEFENFFFYLPEPSETPTIPETMEWYYAKSDALKGYEEIAKADGVWDPSDWFTLSKENGNTYMECRLVGVHGSGNQNVRKQGPKNCCFELMKRISDVFYNINTGVNYTDFGFVDLEAALSEL